MPPVAHLSTFKINWRSVDLATTRNGTSDGHNMSISLTFVKWHIKSKVLTPVVDLSAAYINLRSFDLSMTTNETSDDLHNQKNKNFIANAEWRWPQNEYFRNLCQVKYQGTDSVNCLDQLEVVMTENTNSDYLHDHINDLFLSCFKCHIKWKTPAFYCLMF